MLTDSERPVDVDATCFFSFAFCFDRLLEDDGFLVNPCDFFVPPAVSFGDFEGLDPGTMMTGLDNTSWLLRIEARSIACWLSLTTTCAALTWESGNLFSVVSNDMSMIQ